MIVALRELWRRPGRFVVAGISISLLTVLLLLLGGLLDGLYLGSTGAIRAQDADVFVYSADAQDSFLRSRITPEVRADIEGVDGVASVGGLGVTLVAGRVGGPPQEGSVDDLLDLAVLGYEAGTHVLPDPPGPGEAYADQRLQAEGVAEGDIIFVGPTGIPIEVVGLVDDASYLLQGSLWVDLQTWRTVQDASRPDAALADDVVQVVLVEADQGIAPAGLAADIDRATGGATSSLTRDEAVLSLPGTQEQNATFTALIGVTFFVVALVTALFFVLLTVERTRLFAAVKALGVPNSRLVMWSVLQGVAVAAGAFVVGGLLTLLLASAVPAGIPLQLEPGRAVTTALILLATAAVGTLLTLRRIIRIDPASAIS